MNENGNGRDVTDDMAIEGERDRWDVWVENQHGGLCVRGTAETVGRGIVIDH